MKFKRNLGPNYCKLLLLSLLSAVRAIRERVVVIVFSSILKAENQVCPVFPDGVVFAEMTNRMLSQLKDSLNIFFVG